MNLRKFRQVDQDGLISLWSKVFPDDPPHNAPEIMIEAKLAIDDLIFVAEEEGHIIGACMAGYDGHRGWLYAVAVLPEHRRKRVGEKLVKQALATLAELGCIKINLQIRATNTEVAKFYQSLGFITEERLSMSAFIESNA